MRKKLHFCTIGFFNDIFLERRSKMNFKETIEFQIFTDVWNFFKRYYQVRDDDNFWNRVIEESNQIAKKYDNKFANDLLISVIKEMERKLKNWKVEQDITS